VFLKVGVTLHTYVYFLVRRWKEVLARASTVRYHITIFTESHVHFFASDR
jgi:hypothetical protein